MDNEITQEIAAARFMKLERFTDAQITKAVSDAITSIQPGAMYGLQGLDAGEDGVTKALWNQAVIAADSAGSLVFPQYAGDSAIPADEEPCSFGEATQVIAGRVARAILVVNGFGNPADSGDDWYLL